MLHPDYRCFDYRMGMEIDFEAEKSFMETISPFLTLGPQKLLHENDEFYVIMLFSKYYESQPRCIATMVTAKPIGSQIYRHKIVREVLDYDPTETHDWNWEDYE